VKNLLARKQAPKGWQYFTVHAITHHSETASGYEGTVAAEMVGAKSEESGRWGWNPLRDHVGKSTGRPEFSLIALVCAGYEKTIAKDSWRSPSQTHRDYLNQLVTWGYTPSEVEQIILESGKDRPEQAGNLARLSWLDPRLVVSDAAHLSVWSPGFRVRCAGKFEGRDK
jgi:ParB family chromosome partitioning protein